MVRTDDDELTEGVRRARSNLALSSERMYHIRSQGIQNVPDKIRQNALTEKSAKSLRGDASDFREIEGDGDAMRLNRQRKVKVKPPRILPPEQKGRADIRAPTLNKPATRPMRFMSEEGRSSFHFAHQAVSKIRELVIDEHGRVLKPGAAKNHQLYLERDGAVATMAPENGITLEPETGRLELVGQGLNQGVGRELSRQDTIRLATRYDAILAILEPGLAEPGLLSHAQTLAGVWRLSSVPLVHDNGHAEVLLHDDALGHMAGRRRDVGLTGDGVRRARAGDRQDARGAGEGLSGSAEQLTYIERQEALARQPDGSLVLFTNIDADPIERARYWDLVEKHEREPEPDRIRITFDRHPEFWNTIVALPDCPEVIKTNHALADHSKPCSFQTEGNEALRQWLKNKPGYEELGKKRSDETRDEYNLRRDSQMVAFMDGRGGRVQYRLIGELPHELTLTQRAALLQEFADEFERRKLPYVAVMHAPDHTNDDRNWHFHIVYHDRPANRIDASQIAKVRADNPTTHYPRGMLKEGVWDFTVVGEATNKWSNKWATYPLRQPKVREVSAKAWIPLLRQRLADITNDHLERGAVGRRLDARTHAEMGIAAEPQEHLGSKLASLEAMGVETPVGTSNEEKQWAAILARLAKKLAGGHKEIDRRIDNLHKRMNRLQPREEVRKDIDLQITRYEQYERAALEHEVTAEQITQHVERVLSRANKTLKHAAKQLEAIQQGKASRYLTSRRAALSVRMKEAEQFIDAALPVLKMERDFIDFSQQQAEIARIEAQRHAEGLERTLERADHIVNLGIVEQPAETKQTAMPADAKRPALTKSEMDAWIDVIRNKSRRLAKKGGRIEPKVHQPGDEHVLAAINYSLMSARLEAIIKRQDEVISSIADAVRKNPKLLVRVQLPDGKEAYDFAYSRPGTRDIFKAYQDEPELQGAIKDALAARQAARNHPEQVKPAPVPPQQPIQRENAPAPSPTAEEVAAAAAALQREEARRRRHEAADQLADLPYRIRVDAGHFHVPPQFIERFSLDSSDFNDRHFVDRLKGLANVQARELKRLGAYADQYPEKLVLSQDTGKVALSPKAPTELVALDRKWNAEPAYQAELARTREAFLIRQEREAREAAEREQREQQERASRAAENKAREAAERRERERAEKAATAEAERQKRLAEILGSSPVGIDEEENRREVARRRAEDEARRPKEGQGLKPIGRIPFTPAQAAELRRREAAANAPGPRPTGKAEHPLIDRWLEANAKQLGRAEIEARAAEIVNDAEASRVLEQLDRSARQRIKEQARRRAEDNRDLFGRSPDGPGPERRD